MTAHACFFGEIPKFMLFSILLFGVGEIGKNERAKFKCTIMLTNSFAHLPFSSQYVYYTLPIVSNILKFH